jgi:hypothetical protein
VRALLLATIAVGSACDAEAPRSPRLGRIKPGAEVASTSFDSTAREPAPPPITLPELVEGGTHWRWVSRRGPIHVWTPKGYDVKRADTIVYVHGFYVHVDQAWKAYKLETQFAASAINAMFIAPEAPASGAEPVSWTSLAELLDEVERGVGQPLPRRRIVAIGHSGAWRTVIGWLGEPEVDTVVLVDAAYGEIDQYRKWVLASDRHRLIYVGDDTRKWTDKLAASLPDTVVLEDFPTLEGGVPREAVRARILYIKSNVGHLPLVTNGTALPMILRTLRAKRLVRVPLAEIMQSGEN